MQLIDTKLEDVKIIEPDVYEDSRGFFMESFSKRKFDQLGINTEFVQDNHSCSQKGVIRGLHFQKQPHGQGKLIRAVSGAIFDVAVDIVPTSPTYGQWVGVELSAANHQMLYIPPQFAHGFCALEDNTHVLYKATNYYQREAEAGIVWNDPALNIMWPKLDVPYIISEKDQRLPKL